VGAIDRLVLTGDLAAHGQPAVYEALRQLLLPWLDRLRLVPGNHDDSKSLRQAFAERVSTDTGKATFQEDLSGVGIIGLDTSRPWRVSGKLGQDQLAWLANALASPLPVVIFMHHPPVAVGTWWLDKDMLRDREAFKALLAGSNVRAVICGHVHQSFEGRLGHIPVWTTPSTAYQFHPGSLFPRTTRAAAGFRVVEFSNDALHSFVMDAQA